MSFNSKGQRVCDECGQVMLEGYTIEGRKHYCSDECLNKNVTPAEYEQLYDDGNGDSCWSTFYDEV